ncbi:unnamed protein product [Thelazia callipaeda]|uniref:C-type lectin domain-containing protein n=1 Tax=Thelazia callipaeda TaxID=103827 RepID=A0A0N5D3Q6_THECL|nr:unnamed protein product [Thelazia callipaeda]
MPYTSRTTDGYSLCLKRFALLEMTWQEAEQTCQLSGSNAHLLSIQSVQQLDWLASQVVHLKFLLFLLNFLIELITNSNGRSIYLSHFIY